MNYQTVLVHVDRSRHAAQRIQVASQIAADWGAHLIGAAMTGISRYVYQANAEIAPGPVVAAQREALAVSARHALSEFEAIARRCDVKSIETRLVDDDPQGGLVLHARYCDLVVVSQVDPTEQISRVFADIPDYVMLNCARPVLIVPFAGNVNHFNDSVLVAWDGSLEATRAISNALPFLHRAAKVAVAVFNAESGYDHGQQPGADIALFLARHGIKVDVVQRTTKLDVGNALLSLAADLSSDLIVMGGYGHNRFREVLLGGVTETLLKTMTVPVLMSH